MGDLEDQPPGRPGNPMDDLNAAHSRSTNVVTNNHFEGKAILNEIQLEALLIIKALEMPGHSR